MSPERKKIVVLGGGYAGLACLVELSRRNHNLDLHLVDADTDHCTVTGLHKTFHTPLSEFLKSYDRLGAKFRFCHHQSQLSFGLEKLSDWQVRKGLDLPEGELTFDVLVVATGSKPVRLPRGPYVFGLSDLRKGGGMAIIDNLCARGNGQAAAVTFIGGGATGVQAVFEARNTLHKKGFQGMIRLVNRSRRLAPDLPAGFHDYILQRMVESGIEYFPEKTYLRQSGESLLLQDNQTGEEVSYPSQLTFLFPGVAPTPLRFETNPFGQVRIVNKTLDNIFAAGDCSLFLSSGLNHMTAQAAVRKGKLVAQNIVSLLEGRAMKSYSYQEKGYFISLGPADGIGWIGLKSCLVKGFPAVVCKETAETQYQLLLGGVDTYDFIPKL